MAVRNLSTILSVYIHTLYALVEEHEREDGSDERRISPIIG